MGKKSTTDKDTKLNSTWDNRIVGHELVAVYQLLNNPLNWRIHTDFQRAALKGVIKDIGYIKSITVNKVTGCIVDGHLRAALAADMNQEFIPVEYVELSEEEEAEALAVIDPISALAYADQVNLDRILQQIHTDDAAVAELLSKIAEQEGLYFESKDSADSDGAATDGDEKEPTEDLVNKWGVEAGQVWAFETNSNVSDGYHRLLCDSVVDDGAIYHLLNKPAISLVIASPPRSKLTKGSSSKFKPLNFVTPAVEFLLGKAALYTVITHRDIPAWRELLDRAATYGNTLIFIRDHVDKGEAGKYYDNKYLAILYHTMGNPELTETDTDLWNISKDSTDKTKTFLPVALYQRIINQSSQLGQVVFDPFAGTGACFMAAESVGRLCYGMDRDPKNVAVILQRFADKGIEPVLVEDLADLE